MGSRKVNTEGIDEELLLASIGRRTQDGHYARRRKTPQPYRPERTPPHRSRHRLNP